MLLLEFVGRYIETRIGLKRRSADQLRTAVNLFEAWNHAPLHLSDLSEELLTKFLVAYRQSVPRQVSPATINSKRRAILTLWRAAAKRYPSLCRPPIDADVPKAREAKHIPQAWTVSEVELLVAHSRRLPGSVSGIPRRSYYSSLFLSVWDTGCRIGALLSARSLDLSIADRYLLIRAENQKQAADQLFWLSDTTIAAIAAHYDAARDLIWPWKQSERWFFRTARKIIEGAGLHPPKSGGQLFHRLRRSNLSYCAAVDLELARRQAGHYSSRLTQTSYVDPRIARQRSAVDVLPKLHLPNDDEQMRLF